MSIVDYKEQKIMELEEKLDKLQDFVGIYFSHYSYYPYKRKDRGGYWILMAPMNEVEEEEYIGTNEYRKYEGVMFHKEIAEHRYVMEKHLGFKIPKGYDVHHKDRNKCNNNLSNLELLTKKEHHSLRRPNERSSR